MFALSALVALATFLPLVQLAIRASGSGLDSFTATLLRPRTLTLLVNTLAVSAVVAVGCFVIGVLTAWVIVQYRLPARRLWWVLACLPLAVPSYVAAFAWLATWPGIHGFWPLSAVMILTSAPLVTIPTLGALVLADRSLVDVARTLGRGPLHTLATVTLPQILPAALAGTLLVVLYTLSDFGAPAMLRYETLTTGVYGLFTGGLNRTAASSLALLLAAVALVCISGERALRHRTGDLNRSASTSRRISKRMPTGLAVAVQVALGTIAFAAIGFPVTALLVRMFDSVRYASDWARLLEATGTTLLLGAVAASATVALALPISYLASRYRSRMVNLLESMSFLGDALPGVVVALALVSLALLLGPGAYQSVLVLLACYVILFVPKAIGSARSAFGQVSIQTEDVSRTLGRSAASTWFSVTLRGAAPGIAAGWLLVLVSVFKELPATLMLRPIGVSTLATELWGKTTLGAYGAAAPIGILLILVGLIPAWWLSRSVSTE
ncbi:iron ABC transporter permease [Paeniglutamicibacter sp. ZC-3]|uniref:ABC transporter permease n=1 Tax=Paeniglutamicibacter sp. ZC-3 TaxID=2986919 RepID=UPI0021F76CE5|nr:iron ABC transporter permease [Paeniglutamicibacter sp. ZC-3]MCV9994151.1 iron ABC transporter permease [Paeniglutamicibacter sp. ZC-3]